MLKKSLIVFFIIFLIIIIPTLYSLDKQYFLCPIEYKNYIVIRKDERGSGEFAASRIRGYRHQGIDLYAEIGTAVKAARLGKVEEVGFHKNLGNYVQLRHFGNLVTIYAHLSKILVKPGQWVKQGMIIGLVGKTGNANHPKILPHLHFEIRQDNIPMNPNEWLEIK